MSHSDPSGKPDKSYTTNRSLPPHKDRFLLPNGTIHRGSERGQRLVDSTTSHFLMNTLLLFLADSVDELYAAVVVVLDSGMVQLIASWN